MDKGTDKQDVQIKEEFEAEDTLAVRLKKLQVEGAPRTGPIREILEKQARTIVKDVGYLDGELALIEVDGAANAVQIRTKKPAEKEKFVEVILRGGNSISVEGRGGAVHVARENYEKLKETLRGLVE
jgi:hypothetical protein